MTPQEIREQAAAAAAKQTSDMLAEVKTPAPDAAPATKAAEEAAKQIALLQDQLAQAMQMIAQLSQPAPVPAKPQARTYFSTMPVCNFHVMRTPGYADAVQFVGGTLTTDDPLVIHALDQVVDKPGTGITSRNARMVSEEVSAMRADVMRAAVAAHDKMVAAGLPTV